MPLGVNYSAAQKIATFFRAFGCGIINFLIISSFLFLFVIFAFKDDQSVDVLFIKKFTFKEVTKPIPISVTWRFVSV